MLLYTENRKQITVEDTYLGSGGQGSIHRVLNSVQPPIVIKIFSKNEALDEQKIRYMCENNPLVNAQQMVQESFTWPIEPIFDANRKFVGYSMPMIENSKTCFKLTNASGYDINSPSWLKFNIKSSNSYNIRLRILYNILQALVVLNESGQYCVVDMKPENIMLNSNGHISIIDIDNFQIVNGSNVMFAKVTTGEYCPPEGQMVEPKNTKIDPSWDYFSFAVIAYQLLFCIHPYYATHPKFTTLEELIGNGLFVHGRNKNQLIIPPPHNNFNTLISKSLQDLFFRCFDDGHKNPDKRPNYVEWRDTILNEIYSINKINITAGANQPSQKSHLNYRQNKVRTNTNRVAYISPRNYVPVYIIPKINPPVLLNIPQRLNPTIPLNTNVVKLNNSIIVKLDNSIIAKLEGPTVILNSNIVQQIMPPNLT